MEKEIVIKRNWESLCVLPFYPVYRPGYPFTRLPTWFILIGEKIIASIYIYKIGEFLIFDFLN